jgi:hypothetical protein
MSSTLSGCFFSSRFCRLVRGDASMDARIGGGIAFEIVESTCAMYAFQCCSRAFAAPNPA